MRSSALHGCHEPYALLVAANEVHGKEPLTKRDFRVFKDSPDSDGKIGLAVVAMKPAIRASCAMVLTTERAYDVAFRPTRVEENLAAFLLTVEVCSKFEDIVEMVEVNHKSPVQVLCTIIYLQLGIFFHKSPIFFK